MVTAVLFVNNASPTTITQFHDMIMNQLPETLPSWEFELGIFLNNKFSKPLTTEPNQVPNRYMYTLQLSYLNEEGGNKMISIINNHKSVVTCVPNSTNILSSLESFTTKGLNYYRDDEPKDSNAEAKDHSEDVKDVEMSGIEHQITNQSTAISPLTDIDDDLLFSNHEAKSLGEMKRRKKLLKHIQNGCCNNLHPQTKENLEFMLVSRLQSLWTLKQTIRGQSGLGYILNAELEEDITQAEPNNSTKASTNESGKTKTSEKFKLRTINCLLHGLFKGFLIEIEHLDEEMEKLEIDNELKNIPETERKNKLIMRFTRSIAMIKSLISTYNFPDGKLCFNVLSDSKLDYLSDLCQQYCDALQM